MLVLERIITGVQNSSRNESVLEGGVNRFPTNGIREKVSAANRGITYSIINETEERSVVIYDHLGNLVTKNLLEELVP